MKKESGGKKDGRMEKVIVTVLAFLVFGLAYSVGVLHGKNMSDRDYAMKASGSGHQQAAHGAEGEDEILTDEEANSVADAAMDGAQEGDANHAADAGKDEHAAVAAKGLPSEVASHGTSPLDTQDPGMPHSKEVAKNDIAKSAGTHDKGGEERTPSSVNKKMPTMPKLEYTVQVASYPELKDAEKMSTDLVKKGYPAFPFTVSINGQTWHRVSIGGYKTKKEALTLQAEMTKQGVIKDSVVQKISR